VGNWAELRLVGIDTETTGLSVTEDRVFEIGLVTFEGGAVVETWNQLLDPLRPLSPESSQKTGVTDADLKGKPAFATIAAEVAARLDGRVVVGYNLLSFDLPLVENELRRVGLALPRCWPVDVLIFARELVKTGRHNLSEMARHFEVAMDTAHRATADADACVRILMAMAPKLPPALDDLLRLQTQWLNEQRARKAVWRQRQDETNGDALLRQEVAPGAGLVDERGRVSLGPGYLYGRETDPLRAFLSAYCAANAGRPADQG
jgi:DNA polymerase-3 subunit epsilon